MRTANRHHRGQVLMVCLVVLVVLTFLGLGLMQLASFAATREGKLYRRAQGNWRAKGAVDYSVWQLISTDKGARSDGQMHPDYEYDWGYEGESIDFPLTNSEDADSAPVDILVEPHNTRFRIITCETTIYGTNVAARALLETKQPPPWLGLAILTEDDLDVTGSALVESRPGRPGINADIHTNAHVTVGNAATIRGFVSASETADVEGTVNPVDTGGLDYFVYEGTDPIDIPEIDPEDYRADACVPPGVVTQTLPNKPVSLTDAAFDPIRNAATRTVNFGGTIDNPSVLFIDGDFKMTGQWTFTGYGMIVVTGTFTNVGGAEVEPDPLIIDPGSYTSQLALIANQINLGGNSVIEAMLYARRSFSSLGTAEIHGSAISRSLGSDTGSDFSGNFTVYYEPSNERWFDDHERPARLSYQTRAGGEDWGA